METPWASFFSDIDVHLIQRSKQGDQDFHDRFIKAICDDGETIIWDLGRGIERVMSARRACVVNAYKECA